jgi:alanine racemase
MAVVKADAYGHGAVACARRLEREGADWFGVASPEEGIELRHAGITRQILCLGGFWPGQERACLKYKLTPVVYRTDALESLDRAARETGIVAEAHVKIDSGMGRLGIQHCGVREFCAALQPLKNLRVDGLMTHLAAADHPELNDFTGTQQDAFEQAVEVFRECGIRPTYFHLANSAATFGHPRAWGNMVRAGGVLYGLWRDVLPPQIDAPPLRPVMSLRSRIMLLKRLPAGHKLGYGCTFETARETLVATLPIGYHDGYPRALSNRGRVVIRRKFAPVIGRVSMDLTLVDVTDVPDVSIDDQVTLLGRDGDLLVPAEEIGQLSGTISYEVTCGVSVPHTYKD